MAPLPKKRSVATASGRIAYAEAGSGPVALFVHGVLLNGHLWRHQLAALSDMRRCIALDLLGRYDDLTTLSVDLGFSSHSHFSAAFRQAYGRTPAEFQRSIRPR